jgi:hypothetical protein
MIGDRPETDPLPTGLNLVLSETDLLLEFGYFSMPEFREKNMMCQKLNFLLCHGAKFNNSKKKFLKI